MEFTAVDVRGLRLVKLGGMNRYDCAKKKVESPLSGYVTTALSELVMNMSSNELVMSQPLRH